jgi:hypothetical protein
MRTRHARFWKAPGASGRFGPRALYWCSVFLVAFLFAANAPAANGAARIVLVTSGNEELARRVRAEAEHVGISIASDSGTPASGDTELLQRHAAVGVVELRSSDRVRIYVAPSGEHGAYETAIDRAPADGDGFALRVVEQLRGRLVELRILPPEPESGVRVPEHDPTPPPAREASSLRPGDARGRVPAKPSSFAPTLGLAVGTGGTLAVGDMGVNESVALGLRLEPLPQWATTLRALLPITENDIVAPEGSASVGVTLFLAEFGYRLGSRSQWFQPEIGAGAGLTILSLEGETAPPREAHNDSLVAGLYFLQGGAGFFLAPWLRMRGVVRFGTSAPRPVVRFSDREVASWGRFVTLGTFEAEFLLPLSSAEATP